MQQDYPQSADGFQGIRTELTLQLDEVKRVKNELQQRQQQERQIEQVKAQQIKRE